jgi:hypothetical protein
MANLVVTKKPGKAAPTVVKTKTTTKNTAPTSDFYPPGQFWEMPKTDLGPPLQLQDMSGYTNTLGALLTNPKYQIPAINYNQINKYASKAAGRDIGWEVGAYHTEQDRLRKAGAAQALLIQQAANAAANLAKPEAGNIQDAYLRSAEAMRNFSAASTGDLQAAGQSENDKLIAQLQGIGSQQTPDAGQLSALNQATDYVGGVIPGNTLASQGASAYTAAAAMPDAFRGYGLQQGLGVRGAAQQEADKYNLDINKVIATRGKLTQDYATTLSEQAQARQKIATDTRNQQIELVGKLADITDKSNKTQISLQGARIAVAKLQQAGVALHNATIRSQNAYNLSVVKTKEMLRHNQITEEQANTRINNAAIVANNNQINANRNFGLAQIRAQTGIANAQTQQDTSRGYYFHTDSKGNAVGLPQPTQNHRIVWASGVPGKGDFRSVLVHSPGTGGSKAGKKASAIKAASKLLDEVVSGKPPTLVVDARHPKGFLPGWDPATQTVTDPQAFIGGGGKAPLSYWDAVNVLRHAGGDVLSVDEVRKILDERFAHPGVAASHNLTAFAAGDPQTFQNITGWQGGTDKSKKAPTGYVPTADASSRAGGGGGFNFNFDKFDVASLLMGGGLLPSQLRNIGGFTNDYSKAWQNSGYVRPAAEFLGSSGQGSRKRDDPYGYAFGQP